MNNNQYWIMNRHMSINFEDVYKTPSHKKSLGGFVKNYEIGVHMTVYDPNHFFLFLLL